MSHQRTLSLDPRSKMIIITWDLSRVKEYMINKGLVSSLEVNQLEDEYKCFLMMCLSHEEGVAIPISRPVDQMWHTHILFTKDYQSLGQAVGRFIHHNPTVSEEERSGLADAYTNGTIPLYRSMFGEPSLRWWPQDEQVCHECCND